MKRLLGSRPSLVLLNVGLLLFLVTASAHALPERQPARERGGDSARIVPGPPSDTYPQMQGTPMPAAAPDRYIVVLRPGARDSQQEADDLSRQHGLTVSHTYRHAIRGFAAQIPPGRLAALRNDPRVELIAPDLPVHAFAQQASTGVRRMGASEDGVHQTASYKGTGVGVAIIDTGIDLTHPDLTPVQNGTTCVSGTSNANDDQGHGTHVAGIVAARDNDIGVVGVAPEASLYAVKVLDSTGSGSTSSVICGIDWVTANAGAVGVPGKIQVANLSLGGPGTATASNPDCSNSNADLMHTAICRSVQAGITYTIAAGNSSADASGFVPAAYSEGITVSALSDSDGNSNGHGPFTCTFDQDDTFASYSNYGAPVDIAAPGSCINSTWPGGGYQVDSGTSMAAPHVAGAAALYKQANPGASPAQVKAGLLATQEVGPIPNDPDPFHEGVVHVTSPMALPARLNSGGASFTDGQGVLWSADRNNVGGYTFSTTAAIAGTTQDPLYQSERYGDFGYAIDVPNGTYTVTLKFAEIYFTSAGLRKFNVAIEGQTVLSNFDIMSEVPANTALDKTFVTNVNDGTLNIVFTTILGNAKVSAVEVRAGNVAGTLTPTPIPGTGTVPPSATLTATATGTPGNTSTPTATFTPTATSTPTSTPTPTAAVPRRVNAGGGNYTDTQGQAWIADTSFTGGGTYSASGAIAGTADPTLYQVGRYGNFSYDFPVPNGTYTVNLKFAEPNRTTPGRVFHVDIEGQRVLSSFDVLQEVGSLHALDRGFVVNVADGMLNVVFTSVSDYAIVSVIEVLGGAQPTPTLPPAVPQRINAGGPAYTASTGFDWSADRRYVGGSTYNASGGVTGLPDPTLYQTGRYGNFSYSFPVPNGTYTVTLKFAEPNRNGPGRVFHVDVEGQRVLSNYDVFVDVGYLHAVDKQFVTQVADGALDIVFTSVSDYAIVSAIQVVDGSPPGGTPTATATATPLPTNTAAPTGTPTNTATAAPTGTPTNTATATPTSTSTPGATATDTPIPAATATATPTSTATATATNTPTNTATATATGTPTPTATPTAGSAATATPTSGVTPQRVNAGGSAYTDSGGQVWSADGGASGGGTYGTGAAVAGTADSALYQDGRYGNFSYSFPVPNGTYTVTLKFAEPNRNSPGRVFHVDLEGQRVLSNFDVWQEVGLRVALDRTYIVQVSDGALTATFTTVSDAAIVSAIQVVAGAQPLPTPTPSVPQRINAGGPAYTASTGFVWSADRRYSGGSTYGASGTVIAPADPALYQDGRYGNFSYSFPVPNGTYTVTLKFAEPNRNGPGRVFHVDIEGQRVLTNYDVFVDVGYLHAVDKQFVTQVADGALDIVFTSVSDFAIVSAIQVVDGSSGVTALSAPNQAGTAGSPGAPTPTPAGASSATPQPTPTRTPTPTITRVLAAGTTPR